ncbi:TFIIH complex serine/threonine-protein kinase subunit kin28 [Mycoemilia scoparia]|uniref:[RNA-polymerase]-subunit kinase n=1 Tax=Mycoemilia scoparia TaxID=417184 RepID=A0A9W8DQ61_9FUNG|nr:TFIIH complex serine/threonine-protein kinase subunit kin28 [Mycoemilia scoparia]
MVTSQLGEDINTRIVQKYKRFHKLGEGTYAVVYLGSVVETGRKVAIKKIKIGSMKSGLDMSAIREVKALRELKHHNVIELLDVYSFKTNLNLVLEYLDTDLEQVIKDKSLDMKPNNLLIDSKGVLKLADFGLARDYGDINCPMTSQTVTRWYRSPELLFGSKYYTGAVDMWAAGCIFAELMLRTPYMAGNSDMNQLDTIFKALGTPTEEEWPGMTKLPDYIKFEKTYPKNDFRALFTGSSQDALSLLESMLVYDPRKRITAKQALAHAYFQNSPLPSLPEKLPKPSKTFSQTDNSANNEAGDADELLDNFGEKKRKIDQVSDNPEDQIGIVGEPLAKRLDFSQNK